MFVTESSIITKASPEAVWKVWSDVNNWSKWNYEVEHCQFSGQFKEGATALLKPKGGPRVTVEIIECVAFKRFVSNSPLACCTSLVVTHDIQQIREGTKVTHRIEINGCLSYLFYCILGSSSKRQLPHSLEKLGYLAEKI